MARHDTESDAEPKADVFGFSAQDMQAQSLRNVTLMLALPWAAAWMLGAEMASETLKRAGF